MEGEAKEGGREIEEPLSGSLLVGFHSLPEHGTGTKKTNFPRSMSLHGGSLEGCDAIKPKTKKS